MATGKKNAKVKWAIDGSEPDDLPDFQSNDDIVRKNKGKLPPKGRTRVLVKKVTSKENKNGDQMLTVTCEIAEKGSKKEEAFNGYTMWERLNITEQGKPYVKRFLTAIGVTWKDFVNKTVADASVEPMVINKIGSVKLDRPVEAYVSVRYGTNQADEEEAEVGRFLAPVDEDEEEPDDDDADESEDEEEDDDDIDVEEDDDDDDDDDSEDDEDSDEDDDEDDEDDDEEEDAEEELRAELKPLKLPALKKRALRAGADEDDMPGKKADLIEHIIELELADDEEDDDEDDDEDEEDESPEEIEARIKAELKSLDLTELRDRARLNKIKKSEITGAKKPALVKMILAAEVPPF